MSPECLTRVVCSRFSKQSFSSHQTWLSVPLTRAFVRSLSLLATGPFALRSCPRWMTAFSSQECFFLKAYDEPQKIITDKLWKTDLDRGELRLAWYAGPYWRHGLITGTMFHLGYRSLSLSPWPSFLPSGAQLSLPHVPSVLFSLREECASSASDTPRLKLMPSRLVFVSDCPVSAHTRRTMGKQRAVHRRGLPVHNGVAMDFIEAVVELK